MTGYRLAIAAFAVTFIALGVAMTAITAARGGGVGLLLGPLFVALGLGRIFLLRARR
jgi:type IV secretory pathway VirB6-like protein